MTTPVVITFMIVATVFALASLVYVIVDTIVEARAKRKAEREKNKK